MTWKRAIGAVSVLLAAGATSLMPAVGYAHGPDPTPFAGTGARDFSGDGGPATSAAIANPSGVAAGPDGTVYIADTANARIRAVAPNGTIRTVAGAGSQQPDGAPLTSPRDVAVAADGTLYITDRTRALRLPPGGQLTRIAGGEAKGFSGDGGPALAATLNAPSGIAVTADGTVLIADSGNARLRAVTPAGTITTVAGTGVVTATGPDSGPATSVPVTPGDIAVDSTGAVWLTSGDQLYRFSDGKLAAVTRPGDDQWGLVESGKQGSPDDEFDDVSALAAGPAGVYVITREDTRLLRLTTGRDRGLQSVGGIKVSNHLHSLAMAAGPSDQLYIAEFETNLVYLAHPSPDASQPTPWGLITAAGVGVAVVTGFGVWLLWRRFRKRQIPRVA